jgi:hypothetical protein
MENIDSRFTSRFETEASNPLEPLEEARNQGAVSIGMHTPTPVVATRTTNFTFHNRDHFQELFGFQIDTLQSNESVSSTAIKQPHCHSAGRAPTRILNAESHPVESS